MPRRNPRHRKPRSTDTGSPLLVAMRDGVWVKRQDDDGCTYLSRFVRDDYERECPACAKDGKACLQELRRYQGCDQSVLIHDVGFLLS